MTKVRLAAYSLTGLHTAEKIAKVLEKKGLECSCFAPEKYCEAGALPIKGGAIAWAKEGFEEADALIFCCASGIAVRAIAPWVKSKTTDPAVIVTDELANFVIPLLSGHIGGANELASYIADELGSTPVVTTATDIHGLFAVDVFATKNHLKIKSMKLAKDVSAELLSGEPIGFKSDCPYEGKLPKGLTEGDADLGICISKDPDKKPFPRTLKLVPQIYTAGIGCRKDKDPGELEEFFLRKLSENGITVDELRCIASIDLKKDEEGLKSLSKKYKIPFVCFTADELMKAEGEFSSSAFVANTTGVDCVCERAAAVSGAKEIIVKKQAENGMTFALGKYEEVISFE
ncbi:MAG: cobalt-precorrin 5A hydrolase [Firmicutes bacterium]|nr:cobalt-precorrin 5A hydrolase [Bacillota bacterium]